MKKKNFMAIMLLISVTFLVSCSNHKKESDATMQQTPNVVTAPIEFTNIERMIKYPVSILAYKENHLAPATAGRVEKILVDVGDRVRAGQVVAQLDRTNYQQAYIQYQKIRLDLMRMDSLLKVGAIAPQQYDQVKMQYDIAKTNLEFLEDNTTLKSPIDGEVTGKYLNDGEIFTMSPAAGVGKPAIVSIMQLDRLKLLVGVSSKYLPNIKRGMKVDVTSEIYPGKIFSGSIDKIYPIVDNMSKTFTVEVIINNEGRILRPGIFATASIDIGKDQVLVIPSFVIQKQSGTNERFVFIYKDGKAIRKIIEVGDVLDDKVEIVSGLNQGDELIVEGQMVIKDGQAVNRISR
ncbi:MAG TPA: efflux RND transporter periplasmic adaptor subunit [Bacteroidales bacterium]|jgi:RND family efflux transporter MFP subunit|nr:efflux RND transporter periplasmic adaptor subunit [Bacteroidales bacterium]HOE58865.1 efflux RND transporter periplasmic adaptor subunit [Bacteroidales bacterium]HOR05528.1 efflux RND transporter periplasmic adaptor subunit [Bacteroidales bacterium]HOU34596.1 efflux RND transporter periplasmic adaptor subunit [Bacteroidales bacterium]HPL34699.1 efflux RND transporter periplasmic adaptor subunit [Bacteroidales bacterium]